LPDIRKIVNEFGPKLNDTKTEVLELLESEIHEYRLAAVLLLVAVYENEKFRSGWDLQD
jgi:hypothetical protein